MKVFVSGGESRKQYAITIDEAVVPVSKDVGAGGES